jgi:hypothetical protein
MSSSVPRLVRFFEIAHLRIDYGTLTHGQRPEFPPGGRRRQPHARRHRPFIVERIRIDLAHYDPATVGVAVSPPVVVSVTIGTQPGESASMIMPPEFA